MIKVMKVMFPGFIHGMNSEQFIDKKHKEFSTLKENAYTYTQDGSRFDATRHIEIIRAVD